MKKQDVWEYDTLNVEVEPGSHEPQDAFTHETFDDPNTNEKVVVIAISDGCSGKDQSLVGAKWQAETFSKVSKEKYLAGYRAKELATAVSQGFFDAFYEYSKGHKDDIDETHYATLLGVICDSENLVAITCGSGVFVLNGYVGEVSQKNSDLYPIYFFLHPQKKKVGLKLILNDLVRTIVWPTQRVSTFAMATDGMNADLLKSTISQTTDPKDVTGWIKDIATTTCEDGKHFDYRSDDLTLAFLRNTKAGESLLVGEDVLGDFCQEYSSTNADIFLTKSYIDGVIIQPEVKPVVTEKFGSSVTVLTFNRGTSSDDKTEVIPVFEPEPVDSFVAPVICATGSEDTKFLSTLGLDCLILRADEVHEFVPLSALCDPNWSAYPQHTQSDSFCFQEDLDQEKAARADFDLKVCTSVLIKLHEQITLMHKQGVRLGNLRPQDVVVRLKVFPSNNQLFSVDVKIINSDVWAIFNPVLNIRYDYAREKLDANYFCPAFLDDALQGKRDARIAQDWFSYTNLVAHVLTKADPFLEGTLKEHPEKSKDRKYRMENGLVYWLKYQVDPNYLFCNTRARLSDSLKIFITSALVDPWLLDFPIELLFDFLYIRPLQ